MLALIQSREAQKDRADASCFASESITDIYGLGKSSPQTDIDPLSPGALFSLIVYAPHQARST